MCLKLEAILNSSEMNAKIIIHKFNQNRVSVLQFVSSSV